MRQAAILSFFISFLSVASFGQNGVDDCLKKSFPEYEKKIFEIEGNLITDKILDSNDFESYSNLIQNISDYTIPYETSIKMFNIDSIIEQYKKCPSYKNSYLFRNVKMKIDQDEELNFKDFIRSFKMTFTKDPTEGKIVLALMIKSLLLKEPAMETPK